METVGVLKGVGGDGGCGEGGGDLKAEVGRVAAARPLEVLRQWVPVDRWPHCAFSLVSVAFATYRGSNES